MLTQLATYLHWLRQDQQDDPAYRTQVIHWLKDVWTQLKLDRMVVVPWADNYYGNFEFSMMLASAWVALNGSGLILSVGGEATDLVQQVNAHVSLANANPTKRYAIVINELSPYTPVYLVDLMYQLCLNTGFGLTRPTDALGTTNTAGNPVVIWPQNLIVVCNQGTVYQDQCDAQNWCFWDRTIMDWDKILRIDGFIGANLVNNYLSNCGIQNPVLRDIGGVDTIYKRIYNIQRTISLTNIKNSIT